MTLKEHGFEKFGRLVAQNVDQARYLGGLVEADSRLQLMAPVALNVVAYGGYFYRRRKRGTAGE